MFYLFKEAYIVSKATRKPFKRVDLNTNNFEKLLGSYKQNILFNKKSLLFSLKQVLWVA